MHRSCSVRSVGGVSAHTMFVQCRAFSQDRRASGGNVSVVPSQLMDMIPYVLTVLVVVFAVRYSAAPAGMNMTGESD